MGLRLTDDGQDKEHGHAGMNVWKMRCLGLFPVFRACARTVGGPSCATRLCPAAVGGGVSR